MSAPDPDTRRRLAERTLELVRIPSPTGEEDALARCVETFLRDRARPAWLERRGNAVLATFGGTPERPPREAWTVLAGHLDTVPARGHPAPSLGETEIVGLGSTDMKSGLAVMMTLAERAAGREPASPFALVFYDAEEGPLETNGLRRLLAKASWLASAGLAILLEPTDNAAELGCQGSLHARIDFPGIAAHSARPWLGENAVHRGAAFLSRVARIPPRRVVMGPAEYIEVIGVTQAQGGTARNVLPDKFTLNVNLRFAPDRSPQSAAEYMSSLVPSGGAVEIVDLAPAASPRAEEPAVARFLSESGVPARGKQAWTDVAQFAERGVPALNFGPGDPALAHRRTEAVRTESIARCFEVLRGFLGIS
jgi:succinyl-diaminopimelate desuccinylase